MTAYLGDGPGGGGEVAEVILATMAVSGVKNLWFTSGSDLVPFQEAAAKARSTGTPAPVIVGSVHEHVALSAAMGETMVSGGPVAVVAHADLGLLSFGGAIHNASRGGYPVLIATGYPPTSADERTASVYWLQQRSDQGAIVRQYVKWDYRLGLHEDASVVTARAIQVALSAPTGPSYLALPTEASIRKFEGPQRLVAAGELGIATLGSGPPEQVGVIADRLLAAAKPLVITDRVGRSASAVALLEELATEFALGVSASRHRMNLADGHPSRAVPFRLDEADAILVLEHPVPWVPVQEAPDEACFVAAVSEDPVQASIPVYEFRAAERVTAASEPFLAALLEEMRRRRTADQARHHAERYRAFEGEAARRAKLRAASVAAALGKPVPSPAAIGAALSSVLGPDDVFTWELADSSLVERCRPGTLFDKGGSSLGWAVAAAYGARLADRVRPAACLTGDGSYLFGVPSALLWSQAQHEAPVLTVICNNRGYRTGTTSLVERYPDGFAARAGDFTGGTFDPPPDFSAEARAAGAFGRRVTTTSELHEALESARRATEVECRPAVVDVWLPALATGAHPHAEERGGHAGPGGEGRSRPHTGATDG